MLRCEATRCSVLALAAVGQDTLLALQETLRAADDVWHVEAELVHAGVTRRGRAEAVDADVGIGPLAPSHGHRSLDAHRRHALGQDLVLVALRLGTEELPARHRHDLDLHVLHLLGGLPADGHLGAGADEDDVRVSGVKHSVGSLLGVLNGRVRKVRQSLAREGHEGRPRLVLGLLHGDLVGTRGLVAVGRAHDKQVRDHAQRRNRLNGLMGRAVLADSDGVVRRHEDRAGLRERGNADGVAHVVAEDREGRAVRHQAGPVQGDGVRNGTHAELADAEAHVAPVVGALEEVTGALHQGHVRGGQVGGAADKLRQRVGDRVQAVLRVQARGLAGGLRRVLQQAVWPVRGQLLVDDKELELLHKLRVLILELTPHLVPLILLLLLLASSPLLPVGLIHVVHHLELLVLPA
mmetsp:Transcript_18441/g.47409  ORF Transcript_18441/g.47409 Transcript_18441/m.47409 type:complete len:408 (-) Transcript_18441:383-1606(-)